MQSLLNQNTISKPGVLFQLAPCRPNPAVNNFLYRPTIDSDEFTALPDTLENSVHKTSDKFNCVCQLSVGWPQKLFRL